MKVSYNCLKELVDFELEPEALAEVLTDTGLEVEGIEEYNGPGNGMEGLLVAEVKSLKSHPDADRLKIAEVNDGSGKLLQVVCGAPNIAEGQKVVLAPVNSTLYPEKGEPFKIKKSKIRGMESFGMICAEDEIGLGINHDGIMVLDKSAKVGQPFSKYLGIQKDTILEIGLTPNRSDAIGHIGVARDIAAALTFQEEKEYELKWPASFLELELDNKNCPVQVAVKDPKACPRYSGVVIENIKVEPSPFWLRERLLALGVRPINNIVDITNLVLHEFGQPLHAFDLKAIKGSKIVVQKLKKGSKFITLDEAERKLHEDDLMICNAKEPMCMAGVFGGINSGVKAETTAIFLESAHFEAIGIRKTANRHLLRTDAAQKYEKSTDPEITIKALGRAVQLITETTGAQVNGTACDYYPKKIKRASVDLKFSYLDKLCGISIDRKHIHTILDKLDIEIVLEKKDTLNLSVPTYRADVKRPADVVEEIIRIYGLNNIPVSEKMQMNLSFSEKPDIESFRRKTSEFLAGKGFSEMVNNSITQSAYYEKAKSPERKQLVKLLKPSNSELDTLRSNMLFPVLERMAFNLNRKNSRLKFFEFGHTYLQKEKLAFAEEAHLILATTGNIYDESWMQDELKTDLYFLKPIVAYILSYLPQEFKVKPLENNPYYNSGLDYLIEGKSIAQLAVVDNELAEQLFDIDTEVTVADINWTLLCEKLGETKIRFKELPRYPSVRRDLALLLDKEVHFADIEKIAREEGKQLLKAVNLFDIYADKKLGSGKKSYAVSFVFQDKDKTLTDKAIDKTMTKLIKRYETELSAQLRT
ncbi:MAG: phenylalanine--tRNA ligase subunit beta [Chitinophagales bacterium]